MTKIKLSFTSAAPKVFVIVCFPFQGVCGEKGRTQKEHKGSCICMLLPAPWALIVHSGQQWSSPFSEQLATQVLLGRRVHFTQQ